MIIPGTYSPKSFHNILFLKYIYVYAHDVRSPKNLFLIYSKDWLEIRDGEDLHSELIHEKLCGSSLPKPITSSGNAIRIRFKTGVGGERKGYFIKVEKG